MEEVGEGKTGGGLGRTTWNSGWSAKYEYVKRIPLSGKKIKNHVTVTRSNGIQMPWTLLNGSLHRPNAGPLIKRSHSKHIFLGRLEFFGMAIGGDWVTVSLVHSGDTCKKTCRYSWVTQRC